jgi:hypothetical protein
VNPGALDCATAAPAKAAEVIVANNAQAKRVDRILNLLRVSDARCLAAASACGRFCS